MDLLKVYHFEKKIRFGAQSDGGYVVAELDQYDCYISAGISDEESFSRDFIKKYSMNYHNSFAFDGTIKNYPYKYTKNISYINKNINKFNDENNTNLSKLIEVYNNIFLKMDIEGGEYPWLVYINEIQLSRFKQIVIEFHDLKENYIKNNVCFKKLCNTHYLIHAHGNNCGGTIDSFPQTIELTYVNKKLFEKEPNLNTNTLPSHIDCSNCGGNDINLNFYPFVNNNKIQKDRKIKLI